MIRLLAIVALLLAAAPALASEREAVLLQTAPGAEGSVRAELDRRGIPVTREAGRRIQVVAPSGSAPQLRAMAGVVAADPAGGAAFPDAIITQGLNRQGVAPLLAGTDGGAGLTIAVLDLGFGRWLDFRQAEGELPGPENLETRSFDDVNGLVGRNAYGNFTNHGELVAQTVFDYAPDARYVFVNYRTRLDFITAVDWLIERRPDIVVHSNSFIEGRFDGAGREARAVDRAADSGILWFNSAGNYATRHLSGPWVDADGDGILDLGDPEPWTFERTAGRPISFAASWNQTATDLAIDLELLESDGEWTRLATSDDDQEAGADPAERIIGYIAPRDGEYRLRVRLRDGPPPAAFTLFSREIPLAPAGGSTVSSLPTPGDARGALAVGAVDWRGDVLKSYSSHGPTDDGRIKPDLVAPTNTSVMGPSGRRNVGGTSNSAPNAAGAAAVIMARWRRAGLPTDPAAMRERLLRGALDLGDPGADNLYGGGRPRLERGRPRISPVAPGDGDLRRRRTRVEFEVTDASPLANWRLFLNDVPLTRPRRDSSFRKVINLSGLPDGRHVLRAQVRDWPGNDGVAEWHFRVDNTPPRLLVRQTRVRKVAPAGRLPVSAADPPRRRRVALTLAIRDRSGGVLRLGAVVRDARGKIRLRRGYNVGTSLRRQVRLAPLPRGRYTANLLLKDAAGNRTAVRHRFIVR